MLGNKGIETNNDKYETYTCEFVLIKEVGAGVFRRNRRGSMQQKTQREKEVMNENFTI